MAKKKAKKIELANYNSIRFPVVDKVENDMLIIGNFDGVFGDFIEKPNGTLDFNASAKDALMISGKAVIKTIQSKKKVYLLSTEETKNYFQDFLTICRDKGFFNSVGRSSAIKYFRPTTIDFCKDDREIVDCVNHKFVNRLDSMKFDNIIQNPPYNKALHLDFFEKGLDLLTENGKMIIIMPATSLIQLKDNGDYTRPDSKAVKIKNRIDGHTESVVIDNLDNDFGTKTYVPFAIVTIDMSKTFNTIKFVCCGEEKSVKSIYDCNLVGDYATIKSILNKCQKFGDMMKEHIWDEKSDNDGYITFANVPASPSNKNASSNATPESDTWFAESKNGSFFISYLSTSFHPQYEISNEPQHAFKACGNSATNKNYSDKYSSQLCGTRDELENWKHFVFNNKLPLFINIVVTYDNHNNSKPYIPWLVDKQYTDEEINELFGFTDEEIALIDRTIKKYERNSPWFKRYMCGPGSVDSDPKKEEEIINNFIKSLDE